MTREWVERIVVAPDGRAREVIPFSPGERAG
jgi:hypothetical protein